SVSAAGALRTMSLNAPTADLSGTLSTPGAIGTLKLGSISGVVSARSIANLTAGSVSGSIACAGLLTNARLGVVTGTIAAARINNLTAGGLSDATILSGANLG